MSFYCFPFGTLPFDKRLHTYKDTILEVHMSKWGSEKQLIYNGQDGKYGFVENW